MGRGRASFRCGQMSVRREAENRVTINCWYRRQCVDSSTCAHLYCLWGVSFVSAAARPPAARSRRSTEPLEHSPCRASPAPQSQSVRSCLVASSWSMVVIHKARQSVRTRGKCDTGSKENRFLHHPNPHDATRPSDSLALQEQEVSTRQGRVQLVK